MSMKEGPNIALLGALIGDPARANMLSALIGGQALTASELAAVAGVTLQTASFHLGKLRVGGLVKEHKHGRHRYFVLFDDHVADMLETIMNLAAHRGHTRLRTGPSDPALRKARVCYDHLAGELGVRIYDSLLARKLMILDTKSMPNITDKGISFMARLGIDMDALQRQRRPLCRACLDWSVRRSHLAGALGASLLDYFYAHRWVRRRANTRALLFSPTAERAFDRLFPI